MNYALLVKPNNNIAFVDQYLKMCQVELQVAMDAYGMIIEDFKIKKINKATYLRFNLSENLTPNIEKSLYQLSCFHMLFEVEGDSYRPVYIDFEPDFGDDLSIRLKYSGKTNEQITRMMMMMAYHLSDFVGDKVINVFDPLCGRGTTLFEAMISGFNAYGVERDQVAFKEMSTYITRYIKEARFKHNNKRGKVMNEGHSIGESFELEYAKDKENFKNKEMNYLKVLRGNTTQVKGAFRKNLMHLIVADLPYNVQHKGKSDAGLRQDGLGWLLETGLAEWDQFLKVGGCIAVSWNIYTDKRDAFVEIFEKKGYKVMDEPIFKSLEHRVGQAITRDIIIAKKL